MRTAVETGTNRAVGSLQSFRGLDLTVRRRLDGLLHGEYGGVRLGPGSDAEELARYQPGHDVRRIDWKVTARARRAAPVVDAGASTSSTPGCCWTRRRAWRSARSLRRRLTLPPPWPPRSAC